MDEVLRVMKEAYERDRNAIQAGRKLLGSSGKSSEIIEIAYELQQGNYLQRVAAMPARTLERAEIVADYRHEFLRDGDTLLDLGTGEGTVS